MKISKGNLYFISDNFFTKVNDPYLKTNYENTKRPHYFAFLDEATGLYWLIPCSSQIDKFERLIKKKQEQHKPTDTIKIVKIFDRKTVLLFQDMFPVTETYFDGQYIKGGQPVRIANPKLIQELEKNARKIIKLLHQGIRFTPTQPDVLKIEKMMQAELQEQKSLVTENVPNEITLSAMHEGDALLTDTSSKGCINMEALKTAFKQ